MTLEQYRQMFEQQGGVCAICKQPEEGIDSRTKQRKNLHVDHCHKTGKVRGLLCGKCNVTLGQVGESIDRLQALIDYLERMSYRIATNND